MPPQAEGLPHYQFAAMAPNTPVVRLAPPALKYSTLVGPDSELPLPNSIPQSPGMVISNPPLCRKPWNVPFVGLYAPIQPLPVFPTRIMLLKVPKLACVSATPHG